MPTQELTESIYEQSVFQNANALNGADAGCHSGAGSEPPAIGPIAASSVHAATDLHEECAAVGAGVSKEGRFDGSSLPSHASASGPASPGPTAQVSAPAAEASSEAVPGSKQWRNRRSSRSLWHSAFPISSAEQRPSACSTPSAHST